LEPGTRNLKLPRSGVAILMAATAALSVGCAAVTNPVADGIPVRRLPAEVLGRPRADLKPIPLTVLRQREITTYTFDKGDVLAVVADNIIAPPGTVAPVKLPDPTSDTAATGFPVPIADDGTITLPQLSPIQVKGKTAAEVEKLIIDAASGKGGGKELVKADAARVTVQLLKKREYTVTVVREDLQPGISTGVGGTVIGTTRRGNGFTLKLPAGQNDVLHALNQTGGLPGLDAKDEVIVERAAFAGDPARGRVKIPLRIYPEQALAVCEDDVILRDGDVLKIETRDTSQEVFYAAGVAGSRQFQLPRDYDLDVIQALTVIGAPLANGGFTQNAFVGQAVNTGLGSPSPALLTVLRQAGPGRQIPIRVDLNLALKDPRERLRVLPGDILVLQERPGDAVARYFTQTVRLNSAGNIVRAPDFTQTITGNNP
jgi:protein involved in polysaccharide export with SLBB domain